MSPSPPKRRVTIELETFHEDGLEQLAGLIPHENTEELLKIVISRGLVEMLKSEFERHQASGSEVAENLNAAKGRIRELQSGNRPSINATMKNSLAFPSRMNMMVGLTSRQDRDELHALEAERDQEVARMRRDLGLAETPAGEGTPDRQVENYIGVPLSEDLRQGLESIVNAYPDVEEESLFSALLELGVEKVQEDPKVLRPWRAAQGARLPLGAKQAARHQFRTGWRLLCRSVARGWR